MTFIVKQVQSGFLFTKKKGGGGNNIYKHYQFIPNLVFGLSVTPALMN